MPAEPNGHPGPCSPFRPARPVVVGLLGGVASGKSAVAGLFAAHGLRHVDADALARAAAAEPEVVAAVAAAFGPAVLASAGLDREALGRLVFADAAARRRLEAILHPRILARIDSALAAARAAGESVLLDAPLLLETGLDRCCDHVVFVAASEATRAARAAARGWPADELARREATQLPLAEKQARASRTLDNDGPLAATADQVAALLGELGAS
ncbi:MAG: dephospho-CoA kinase [Planctomycetes bacterium]|nr:dephospho-CoA kinase [Planctomycetota bacterium]